MPSDRVLHVVIGEDPPGRLDKALARDLPEEAGLSRVRLARLIAEGAVSRDGTTLGAPAARVAAGDRIAIALPAPEAPEAHRPEAIPLSIVYEDAAIIVIDKPVGMVVHPAPGAPGGTLVNALLHHCGESLSGIGGVRRPGIVHRIDKDTSGLLVVAKTDAAHHALAAQFAAHTAGRVYVALVHGVPDPADPRLRGLRGVGVEGGGGIVVTPGLDRHPPDPQRRFADVDGISDIDTQRRQDTGFQPDLSGWWATLDRVTPDIRLVGNDDLAPQRIGSAHRLGRNQHVATVRKGHRGERNDFGCLQT
ncbi:MAG: pseudouridine synthase [Gemmobacter sp.]